jgi:subtilisin-like proprotein convertase family protein
LDQSDSSGFWGIPWNVTAEKYPTFGSLRDYFRMTTVRHWGENPNGDWTLEVTDGTSEDDGTFLQWKLEILGELSQSLSSGPDPPEGLLVTRYVFII